MILDGRTFTRRYQVERVVLFANEIRGKAAHLLSASAPRRWHCSDWQRTAQLHPTRPPTAGAELYHSLRTEAEPILRDHLVIETDQEVEALVGMCLRYLNGRGKE